ncbi:MAG: MinD/ParA family protein [Candidatus Tectomicrobia bacterium]|uniref:MinD/ParA family protein n=1 Tax=Tectimicrobiota bacterium TaxID=2528274 RepID=A0A932GN78_UNCTE|nr:MinD/ParA family protein [Candidatus Tectomicrobia bacterium]
MDQAGSLRSLTTDRKILPATDGDLVSGKPELVRVIAVTSGKGGVGKTNVVANLAYALTQLGLRVLVLDADLGLANLDVLLGLSPKYTIQHVLRGDRTLAEIMIPGVGGMMILPASSGVQSLAELSEAEKLGLLTELELLEEQYDVLLIDTGAGIASNVMYFNVAAQEVIVVVTPEPTSITDAYALMKVLALEYCERHFRLLVNNASTAAEAKEVYRKISAVADKYLEASIDFLGFIPYDEALLKAVRQQKAVLQAFPGCPASRAFKTLARRILNLPQPLHPKGNIQFFWKRLIGLPR